MPNVSDIIDQIVLVVTFLLTKANITPNDDEKLQTLANVLEKQVQNNKDMKSVMGLAYQAAASPYMRNIKNWPRMAIKRPRIFAKHFALLSYHVAIKGV